MSFRKKLTISLFLVLILAIMVSMISWWGMRTALNSQKQVFSFQNHIERTFYAMSVQEHAFTAEETISHSRLVLDHLAEMVRQIRELELTETDKPQQEQLTKVLEKLFDYEKAFSGYVQQNLEMQTLRSRLSQDSEKLRGRVEDLLQQTSLVGRELSYKVIMMLQYQQEYIANPIPGIREKVSANHDQIIEQITSIREEKHSDDIKLLFYRIGKAAESCVVAFSQYANQHEIADLSHENLRETFRQLNTEFNHAVTTKIEQVNKHINKLQAIIVTAAILAILLSIVTILMLPQFISRPIDQLKQSALRIVGGDLNTSVKITARDEIGELGNLFNRMTSRLRTSFAELETYRDRLEDLVRERTHDLEQEIRERKETEKELAASEKRFRTFFDNSTDGIIIVDPSTKNVVLANRTICSMLGYSEQEFLGLKVPDMHPPKDIDWILESFETAATGKFSQSNDIPIQRKDGTIFPAEISGTTIDLGDQSLLLGCFRDITDRKAVEEERLKMRKLESVGILAGGIAHDFNNILAAILGNVSLVLALTDEHDKRHQLLKALEKASIRARDLTMQLLTFSKGGEPLKEVTDVSEIIRESAEFVLRGSNVRCDFNFADNLWNAEVDPGQISQVIQNIVVNGRHAMPDGGVISISCRNLVPTPQTSERLAGKNCLEITIADTGPGIPDELHERIFDPYFTTKKGGSGLGLAITHSIINKHKGIIFVNSPVERGVVFTILLPAAGTETKGKTKQVVQPTFHLSGKTIMIMDDEEAVREITGQLLKYLGYETLTVADGQEAIDVYRQQQEAGQPVDLVVMDLTIPGGMGGKDAAEKILVLDPGAKLVVASGYSHDPIMANYESFGFHGFLPKPFQLEDLQTVIHQILAAEKTDNKT